MSKLENLPTDDPDAMLDTRRAKTITGLAVATLAKLRCVGGGPPFLKLGRRVVYRRCDILAWLEARRVTSTTEAAHAVPRRLTDTHEAA